jgi:hemoglobin-like flavoprotein
MSPEDKTLVKNTWAMVVPIADVAATLFYERLFALDPALRPMFDRTDMKEQRRKLLAALGAVVNGLDNLAPLIPVLENLGRNHARYGVIDAHYETVGSALLWTLEQGLKDAWTEAAKTAWTKAYGTVAGVMRNAATPSDMPAVA